MAYKTIWKNKGIHWIFSGNVTGDEIIKSSTEIYGNPKFDTLRFQIVDFLAAESFDVTTEAMEEVSVMDLAAAQTNPVLKVAVIATDAQGARLVELYESTTGSAPWETELFTTLADAHAWIDKTFGIKVE